MTLLAAVRFYGLLGERDVRGWARRVISEGYDLEEELTRFNTMSPDALRASIFNEFVDMVNLAENCAAFDSLRAAREWALRHAQTREQRCLLVSLSSACRRLDIAIGYDIVIELRRVLPECDECCSVADIKRKKRSALRMLARRKGGLPR